MNPKKYLGSKTLIKIIIRTQFICNKILCFITSFLATTFVFSFVLKISNILMHIKEKIFEIYIASSTFYFLIYITKNNKKIFNYHFHLTNKLKLINFHLNVHFPP